jgi:hypothetical protein
MGAGASSCAALRCQDGVAYRFGNLRDDGIAESGKALHSKGNPISHSTHVGFKGPSTVMDNSIDFPISARRWMAGVVGPPLSRLSAAHGVGKNRTAAGSPFLGSFAIFPRFCASFAPGVGQGFMKSRGDLPPDRIALDFVLLASGAGNNPDPIAPMRGANGGSRDAMPLRIVPERGQVPENGSESSPEKRGDILHDDVSGSNLANKTGVFTPEAAAFTCEPRAFASRADILAGKSAANNVDWSDMFRLQLPHVSMDGYVRPVLRQHAAGKLLDFAEGDGLEAARPLKAKAEAADA